MQTLDFLKAVAGLPNKTSVSRLLLKHGRQFPTVKFKWGKDVPLKRGRMGECFYNAGRAATGHPERFVYCEGYACCPIPVLHAWVFDLQTNLAYDPTWDEGTDYFGVCISNKWLGHHTWQTKQWGTMLDDWQHKWPILSAKTEEWHHPKMPKI